jgi:hypothetical protein
LQTRGQGNGAIDEFWSQEITGSHRGSNLAFVDRLGRQDFESQHEGAQHWQNERRRRDGQIVARHRRPEKNWDDEVLAEMQIWLR